VGLGIEPVHRASFSQESPTDSLARLRGEQIVDPTNQSTRQIVTADATVSAIRLLFTNYIFLG
jgi:hypothetical protein